MTFKEALGYLFKKEGLNPREQAEQSIIFTRKAEATSRLSVYGRRSEKDSNGSADWLCPEGPLVSKIPLAGGPDRVGSWG